MNTKLLYLFLPLGFSGCLASMFWNNSAKLELDEQLIKAAQKGSTEGVRKFLAQGVAVNAHDSDGKTALHWATLNGRIECVKALIEAKANVNARNYRGETALHAACTTGRFDCLEALLGAKADIDARDSHAGTPLHRAIFHCHSVLIEPLLKAGADSTTATIEGNTPIFLVSDAAGLIKGIGSAIKLETAHEIIRLIIKYSYTRKVYRQEKIREVRARIHAFFELFRDQAKKFNLTNLNSRDIQFWVLRFDDLRKDVAAVFLDELQRGDRSLYQCHTLDLAKSLTVEYLVEYFKEEYTALQRQRIEQSIKAAWNPERDGFEAEIKQLILEGIHERIAEIKQMNHVRAQVSNSKE